MDTSPSSSAVDDEVSFFLFVVPATLPLGCCAKGQESRVPHHSAGGWWMAFPYPLDRVLHMQHVGTVFDNFGLDPESFQLD